MLHDRSKSREDQGILIPWGEDTESRLQIQDIFSVMLQERSKSSEDTESRLQVQDFLGKPC